MLWFNFVFYAATVTSSIRAIEGFARFRAYALLKLQGRPRAATGEILLVSLIGRILQR